ncbi:MAG: SRPBCC family protein [Gammaproteobacteria bacterium]
MTVGEPHYIKLTRVFSAPREEVFSALADESHLRRWCAPRGFAVEECVAAKAPGDAWRLHMRSPKGNDYRSGGVCAEIAAPARLVYTHSWEDENDVRSPETTVTITLEEWAGKTLLTFHQGVFPSVESRDGHEEGWCTSLEKLAEHLGEK